MDRLIKLLNAQLPWVVMMSLITIQSAMTSSLLVQLPTGMDKVIHFLIFGVLGWLLARGVFEAAPGALWSRWLLILVGGALFAMLDEMHQALVPGRHADIRDWLADMAGITAAACWYYYLHVRQRTSLPPA